MSRCSRWPTSRMRQRTARQESASSRGKVGVASWLFPASGASWQPSEICWAGAGQGTAHFVCPPGSVSSPTTTGSWACSGRPIERGCERSSRRATGVVCERLLGEDRAAMTAAPFRMSRIGRHGVVYGAGIVLSKAAAFAMLPIYTRYLSPADYGLLQLIQMVLEVASIIAGSRLGAGIFRFYHKAETPDERRAVLSTALIVLLTSYAAAAMGMYALAPTWVWWESVAPPRGALPRWGGGGCCPVPCTPAVGAGWFRGASPSGVRPGGPRGGVPGAPRPPGTRRGAPLTRWHARNAP